MCWDGGGGTVAVDEVRVRTKCLPVEDCGDIVTLLSSSSSKRAASRLFGTVCMYVCMYV